MELFQVLALAFVQGLTEFLPISSSAHLILPSQLLGWPDQGLAFDVATHVGSLLAVITYFRKDIVCLLSAWFRHVTGGGASRDSHMAWAVIVATIPAGLAGLALNDMVEHQLRSTQVIATTTVVFGLLLWWSDWFAQRHRVKEKKVANETETLGWAAILVVGFSQILALVPGTSRSGVTMTAALFMGLSRELAARFSFLLSIPLIVAAGGLKTLELAEQAQPVPWNELFLGVALSALTAYVCISLFLQFIERIGFLPFVIYRLALGAVLFAMIGMA